MGCERPSQTNDKILFRSCILLFSWYPFVVLEAPYLLSLCLHKIQTTSACMFIMQQPRAEGLCFDWQSGWPWAKPVEARWSQCTWRRKQKLGLFETVRVREVNLRFSSSDWRSQIEKIPQHFLQGACSACLYSDRLKRTGLMMSHGFSKAQKRPVAAESLQSQSPSQRWRTEETTKENIISNISISLKKFVATVTTTYNNYKYLQTNIFFTTWPLKISCLVLPFLQVLVHFNLCMLQIPYLASKEGLSSRFEKT